MLTKFISRIDFNYKVVKFVNSHLCFVLFYLATEKEGYTQHNCAKKKKQKQKLKTCECSDLYGSANDPRTANDPGPQMIPKLDRK